MGVDEAGRAIAARFGAARRAGTVLPDYPGALPATLAEGYAIQDAAIALAIEAGEAVVGWKVGRINPPFDARYGANRFVGPVLAGRVATPAVDGDPSVMAIVPGGFAAVEGEFLLRLGAVDPARRDWTLADAADAVTAVHAGIEVAGSPLAAIMTLGTAVTVSDFGNNSGLVVGPPIPDWRAAAIDGWTVATAIDGVEAGRGTAAAFPDGTLGAVRFLLETLAARGIALAPGSWVSTGAVSGIHPVVAGQAAVVRFGDAVEVRCRIVAAGTTTA